jgi:cell wall assembly regulator SMI1
MSIQRIPYTKELKKVNYSDIHFNPVALSQLPEPYYKDYSHHKNATARNYKSYDTMGFRDTLLEKLAHHLGDSVLKLFFLTPKAQGLPYEGFAYLSNKKIVPMHFEDGGNFALWMDIIFKKQHERLAEYKANGQFKRQPELNPNPQFMLVLGKGQFSQKWVNSGMLIDERPYENMGAYLYKNAPQKYDEVKITKEKQRYIQKYSDTSGADLDAVRLKKTFAEYIGQRNLKPNPPKNNQSVFKEFESLADYTFPKELKVLFELHGGIENTGFLTAEEILQEWKNWKVIYDDPNWMLADLTGNNHPDGRKTIGIYTNPYWVPFFSTGGGNFIAIDYAPGSKGTSGQIIAFGADETRIRLIADNILDFLEQLKQDDEVLINGFEK